MFGEAEKWHLKLQPDITLLEQKCVEVLLDHDADTFIIIFFFFFIIFIIMFFFFFLLFLFFLWLLLLFFSSSSSSSLSLSLYLYLPLLFFLLMVSNSIRLSIHLSICLHESVYPSIHTFILPHLPPPLSILLLLISPPLRNLLEEIAQFEREQLASSASVRWAVRVLHYFLLLSVYLFDYLSIYLFIYLLIYFMSFYLLAFLSACLSVYLSIYFSLYSHPRSLSLSLILFSRLALPSG